MSQEQQTIDQQKAQIDTLTRELERAYAMNILRAAESDALQRAFADLRIEQSMLRAAITELLNRIVVGSMGAPFDLGGGGATELS